MMVDISFPVYGEVYAKNGDKIAPNILKVEQGWVQEMMPFQYENWLQNRQDVAITYLLQKGIPEYNAAQEYVANKSVVLYVGVVYLATASGLLNLPTDTLQWRKLSVTLDSNGIVPVASGGTGASTAPQARTNLGLGTASTLNADFVVQKDGAGNFSAGTITATLAGNATTSSSWLTGRTISLSGAVTGTSSAWKGDGNLTITTTSLDATKLAGEVPSASLPLVVKKSSDTGIAYIPMGTTAERPSPIAPGTRINSTTGMMEFWNGSAWISVTGGAETYFNSLLQTKVNLSGDTMTGNLTLPSLNGGQLAGMLNKIINGSFAVNQRAVSGTVTLAAGAYGHDRWKAGASGCTYTFSTVQNVTTITITAGSIMQVIEGLNLQSGTHVLSWQGTAQGRVDVGAYGTSGAVTGTAIGGTNQTVEFNAGTVRLVQYEPGTVATPFEHRIFTAELAFCQRYFCKTFPYATAPAQAVGGIAGALLAVGSRSAGMGPWANWTFPVSMRATPTITTYSPLTADVNWINIAGTASINITQTTASNNSVGFSSLSTPATPAVDTFLIHATASAEL